MRSTIFHCKRGELDGTVKQHTLFNTGERSIDLTPGQLKHFNMVWRYPRVDQRAL